LAERELGDGERTSDSCNPAIREEKIAGLALYRDRERRPSGSGINFALTFNAAPKRKIQQGEIYGQDRAARYFCNSRRLRPHWSGSRRGLVMRALSLLDKAQSPPRRSGAKNAV
jgi:hypothetical protein